MNMHHNHLKMTARYDFDARTWVITGHNHPAMSEPVPDITKPTQVTLDPFIYDADYCCALVRIGPAIFKCTDRARYGSNVCALHVSHDLIMAVPANAQ